VLRGAAILVTCAALCAAYPSAASASYDFFDDETLNDLNAFGQEVPYTSGAARVFTASFDTAPFSLEPTEGDDGPGNLNGCLETPAVFAGRTAWARFDPAVDGQLHVVAQTPGYDSIVWIREARQAPWGATTFSDVRGRPNNCSDINNAAGDEETIFTASETNVYYVQVGGKCPNGGDRTMCGDAAVPGGPTTIRLTFTPFDSDSDGVPDTSDACPGGERGFVTGDGCPDTDRDGIRDSEEGPGCVGQQGVVAPPPYNGCFDGPDPPGPGGASVVVRSTDDNPDNTASVDVLLQLNWPKGAREAFATNSAGDPPVPIPLQARVPWTLRPAAKSETREVEVTFRGPNIDAKDSDTITLDPQPPRIAKTLLLRSASSRWYVGVQAVDDRDGSGVSRIEVLDGRRRALKRLRICDAASCRRAVTRDLRRLAQKPRFLRAVDAAGNRSKPRALVIASGGCTIKVPMGGWRVRCFDIGDRCTRSNPPLWADAYPALACRKHRVRRR
jgi:hypothetical protein